MFVSAARRHASTTAVTPEADMCCVSHVRFLIRRHQAFSRYKLIRAAIETRHRAPPAIKVLSRRQLSTNDRHLWELNEQSGRDCPELHA